MATGRADEARKAPGLLAGRQDAGKQSRGSLTTVTPRPQHANPAICHGRPTVRGLRYPVDDLLELLASGMTVDEVLADYPDLERDDLLAALEYGALTASRTRTIPLGAA